MNLDMHTMLWDTKLLKATLLNMYNPILMETVQKLREQSKEDDQMKSAGENIGSVPETSLDGESILKELGMTLRKISTEDLVLIARPGQVQRLVA